MANSKKQQAPTNGETEPEITPEQQAPTNGAVMVVGTGISNSFPEGKVFEMTAEGAEIAKSHGFVTI